MSGNNALEILKTRRVIRAYQDKMPEKELILQIVEAGIYAPTGMGKQSPIIVAVTNKKIWDMLSEMNARVMGSDSDQFYRATVLLVLQFCQPAECLSTALRKRRTVKRSCCHHPSCQ